MARSAGRCLQPRLAMQAEANVSCQCQPSPSATVNIHRVRQQTRRDIRPRDSKTDRERLRERTTRRGSSPSLHVEACRPSSSTTSSILPHFDGALSMLRRTWQPFEALPLAVSHQARVPALCPWIVTRLRYCYTWSVSASLISVTSSGDPHVKSWSALQETAKTWFKSTGLIHLNKRSAVSHVSLTSPRYHFVSYFEITRSLCKRNRKETFRVKHRGSEPFHPVFVLVLVHHDASSRLKKNKRNQ